MPQRDWRGCFTIPMTPWDDRDRIDEEALAAEIAFCIEAGAPGLVVPVMVSEFFVLSEDERRTMIRLPLEIAAGRVPVIANVAAVNTPLAARYAAYAQELGAAGVIAMPPYVTRFDAQATHAYFQAISDAVTVPVWIQNAGVAALSADQVARLCTEIEHVSWVKEEVSPSTHSITALLSKNCPAIRGVMGGSAGRFMLTEWARGSKGVVGACEVVDVVQRVWELLDAGEPAAARDLFEKVLPALVLEGLMGMAFAKEIMVRRGVLRDHRMRGATAPLDAEDLHEIDAAWARLEPYLLWRKA
ncbi:MAG: dihydrodipicolinate synthase family protein [Chloroflexi bacterium]|nr:dihydrodipicolinate synthase family protein [Chloroflexota bacterium]